jgi:hypothetical protein
MLLSKVATEIWGIPTVTLAEHPTSIPAHTVAAITKPIFLNMMFSILDEGSSVNRR